METDWGQLYRDNMTAIAALVGDLPAEQVALLVAGTPQWTVREVVAHLAGGPADQLAGRTDGAPGPAWTAVHVAERSSDTVTDLLAEIDGQLDAVVGYIDSHQPGTVWDAAVHHADLHEALGRGRVPDHYWAPVLDEVGPHRLPDALRSGSTDVAAYELFRAVFSRRSRAQLQAWGTGLGDGELDAIGIFGPREDDQPIPGPHV